MNEFNPGHEALLEALSSIQSELKVPKGQVNKYGNYKFRNCDDIVEAIKPYLKKYNLILLMYDTIECINNHSYIKATACLCDTKGRKIEVTALAREVLEPSGILTEPMLTGSASSYARKYALNGLFALDDAKDPDDNVEMQNVKPNQEKDKPTAKQLEIINNYILKWNIIKLSDYIYGPYKVNAIEELTKDQATEIVSNIYKGVYQ